MPAPPRTTNEQVIAAADAILEEYGIAGLTMQAVAARVGVRAPSLYKRFADRAALVAAVAEASVDALAARLVEAAPDPVLLAEAYRAFGHAHPEAFHLIFTGAAPEEALRRSAQPVIRTLAEIVGDERALDAARLFTAWATGFLQMELSGAFRLGGDVSGAFDYGVRTLVAGLRESA